MGVGGHGEYVRVCRVADGREIRDSFFSFSRLVAAQFPFPNPVGGKVTLGALGPFQFPSSLPSSLPPARVPCRAALHREVRCKMQSEPATRPSLSLCNGRRA